MGVGEDFGSFCGKLAVSSTKRSSISDRCGLITRRLNLEFWNSESHTAHSLYAGSYGRNTATSYTSDVDLIAWLPPSYYHSHNKYAGNGQSALLQLFRNALRLTYPSTQIGADGQVVAIAFTDGITFEVLPAFENQDGMSFTYPDSNHGGTWKTTNPRPEIAELNRVDQDCNGNLKQLCRMARAWKHHCDVPIKGLLIDTLAYNFIRDYANRTKSFIYYDYVSRDFFAFMAAQNKQQEFWLSPGAAAPVWRVGAFEYKANQAHTAAAAACEYQGNKYGWTARQKWREIYGTAFPA